MFCETLVGHMFFKCDGMSYSTAFTVKNMLVFLEYIFQFLINKALLASNGVDRQNFIGKRNKDNTFPCSSVAGFRGAIGIAPGRHVGGPGFNTGSGCSKDG